MGVLGNLLSEKGKFGVGENWLKNGKGLPYEKVGKKEEKNEKRENLGFGNNTKFNAFVFLIFPQL